MRERRAVHRVLTGVAVGVSLAGALKLAPAAKAQEKAPPPETPGSRIHGFFDVSLKNDYITPRGLLVTDTGQTVQPMAGLVFSLFNDPSGPVNSVSVVAGIWNDIFTEQGSRTVGSWNEFDWWAGVKLTALKTWKFGVEYQEFLSPPGHFRAESNIEFTLAYDDSKSGFPIAFNRTSDPSGPCPAIRPSSSASGATPSTSRSGCSRRWISTSSAYPPSCRLRPGSPSDPRNSGTAATARSSARRARQVTSGCSRPGCRPRSRSSSSRRGSATGMRARAPSTITSSTTICSTPRRSPVRCPGRWVRRRARPDATSTCSSVRWASISDIQNAL